MNSLFGLRVVTSPLCEREVVEWKVVRHPIRKRRRNWRVVRTTRIEKVAIFMNPAALGFQFMGGSPVLALHPEHAAMLKEIAS